MRWINTSVLLLLLLSSVPASARVWRVEKDGTGDFTIIQQAVDAAAAGDTISIGPGRFDDKFLWGNPPWQQYTRVLVTKANLTLIGAGPDVTIIGDAVSLTAEHDRDMGLANSVTVEGDNLALSSIGFENCYHGLFLFDLGSTLVRNCRFRGNVESIYAKMQTNLAISDCEFESHSTAHTYIDYVIAWGPGNVDVVTSTFSASRVHQFSRELIHLEGVPSTTVANCVLEGGSIGVVAASGSGALEVTNCIIDDQFNKGIVHLMSYGTIRLSDTVMRNQYEALSTSAPGAIWEVDRIVVEDAFVNTFEFAYLGGGHIRNSQLAKGSRYVVKDSSWGPVANPLTFDMTNNWWGTANPDSIQAWIYDGNDQPTRPYYFIDWEPYRSVPVSSEKRSLGGVKSLFR